MQQSLKSTARATWAGVIAPELLQELFVTADDAFAALNTRLGRKTLTTLARDLESSWLRGGLFVYARDTSLE